MHGKSTVKEAKEFPPKHRPQSNIGFSRPYNRGLLALLADSCLQCGGVGLALASPLDYSVVEVEYAGILGV